MSSQIMKQLKNPDPKQRIQAITKVAKSVNPKALPILEKISQQDADSAVRQHAEKAVRFIKKQTMTVPAISVDTDRKPVESVEVTDSPAQPQVDEAVRLVILGDMKRAAKELGHALHVDPRLQRNPQVANLAEEITGKPPKLAIEALVKGGKEVAKIKQKSRVSPVYSVVRWVVLTIAIATLGGLIYWSIETGQFEEIRIMQMVQGWEAQKYTQGRIEYYAIVPEGEVPAAGYPMIVVLHGYGGNAESMLQNFAVDANEKQFILVAPTFGEYPFPYDANTIPTLDAIINRVDREFPVSRGDILMYGFSAGGEIASLYAQMNPTRVAAMVLEGAPEIHPPGAGGYAETVVLYGASDSLRQFTEPSILAINRAGYLRADFVITGYGHQMTPNGREWLYRLLAEY